MVQLQVTSVECCFLCKDIPVQLFNAGLRALAREGNRLVNFLLGLVSDLADERVINDTSFFSCFSYRTMGSS